MADNASKPKAQSTFNPFVHATVDDGVRSLVAQFGVAEVKAAIKRVPTRKGNLPIKTDREKLLVFYYEDAVKWLAGEKPFKTRTSYSVAKAIATESPQHMQASIQRRILRKLQYDRKFHTYYIATVLAEEQYPHGLYQKAVLASFRASNLLANKSERNSWQKNLQMCKERLKRAISQYEKRCNEAPAKDFSLKKIEESNSILNLLKLKRPIGIGLGGLFGSPKVTE
jgi:hypothetical protein